MEGLCVKQAMPWQHKKAVFKLLEGYGCSPFLRVGWVTVGEPMHAAHTPAPPASSEEPSREETSTSRMSCWGDCPTPAHGLCLETRQRCQGNRNVALSRIQWEVGGSFRFRYSWDYFCTAQEPHHLQEASLIIKPNISSFEHEIWCYITSLVMDTCTCVLQWR